MIASEEFIRYVAILQDSGHLIDAILVIQYWQAKKWLLPNFCFFNFQPSLIFGGLNSLMGWMEYSQKGSRVKNGLKCGTDDGKAPFMAQHTI